MFSNTLATLRQRLSMMVGDLEMGACGNTGATTTKINAPFLWQPDAYYNQHFYEVYVYEGTNIGETRRVVDWVLSTKLLEVHSPYTVACDTTSKIELHRIFTEGEYRKAINLAIESLKRSYVIDVIDTSLVLVADTYEYTIPTGITHIYRITTESEVGSNKFYDDAIIDPRDWRLLPGRKLKLNRNRYGITAGKSLRIEGHKTQAELTADTDICYLPPDYILNKALTFLPQNKATGLEEIYLRAMETSLVKPCKFPHPFSREVIE